MVRKLRLCPFQNRAIGINNKQVIRQLTQRKIRNITSAREVGRSVNLHMKVFTEIQDQTSNISRQRLKEPIRIVAFAHSVFIHAHQVRQASHEH